MVKVQKPKPKTLSQVGTIDNPIKKKKHDVKKDLKIETLLADAPKDKSKNKKTKKDETVNEAKKVVQKSEKKQKDVKPKEKAIAKPEKPIKEKKTNSRPLVLAPPESPKPAAPATPSPPTAIPTSGKHKNKKGKVQEAADTTPVAEKKNKKQKKSKKSTADADDAPKSKATVKGPKQQPTKLQTKSQKKKAAIKAYKKQQKKSGKKEKIARPHNLEPVPFDEDKFHAIVNVENIKKIAKALKVQCEKEVAAKKASSIFSDYRYMLDLASFKIPNCPKRIVKLSLKHSLVDKDDDVAVVVPDLKRGAKVDYEPTIQHYEDVFREAGVSGLKIVPFTQLKTECNSFEAVRKFGNTYDYFLCDGRLVGHVAGFTGKIFQKPRTTFHTVRLENPKSIKTEIEKSLRRTAYKQINKGDLISIPVGTHKYTIQQLAENIDHVVTQLKNLYPGGLGNIRNINLKLDIAGTSSLPLYISMAEPPAVTPYVVGQREQRMLKLKKEANEVLTKFAMTKDAQIIKLSKDQVEQKRQVKEAKAALAAKVETPEKDADNDDDDEEETPLPAKKAKKVQKAEAPQDDDDDGEVPTKKAKKEQKAEVEKDSKKKQVEEQAEPEDEDDDDDDAENDSDDEEGGEGEDDDDDDDEEGEDDAENDSDDDDAVEGEDDDDDEEEGDDDDNDGDDNEDSD